MIQAVLYLFTLVTFFNVLTNESLSLNLKLDLFMLVY